MDRRTFKLSILPRKSDADFQPLPSSFFLFQETNLLSINQEKLKKYRRGDSDPRQYPKHFMVKDDWTRKVDRHPGGGSL
jgi:hypothetical protein